MKTSELTGAALDWAVCKAGGGANDIRTWRGGYYDFNMYHYSTQWSQGGPIIEREDICLTSWYERWDACASHGRTAARRISGPTPLIAAMRCYVASKMGDEVEVPEELKC